MTSRSSIEPEHATRSDGPWMTLRRTSSDDMQERELYVSLDGKRVAILLYGDEVTLSIAPGHHEISVHNTISRKKMEFDAASGQHVRFETSHLRGAGFAYLAFFVGAALMKTRLAREEDGAAPTGPVRTDFRLY